jgi:hypothetical protein
LDGIQITVVMHVDDLLITSLSDDEHERFEEKKRKVYREIKISKDMTAIYIGMTFNFIVPGQVFIAM